MSVKELCEDLAPFSPAFFFYNRGVEDAIVRMLDHYVYPTQPFHTNPDWIYNGEENPIMYDFVNHLNVAEKENTLPRDLDSVYMTVAIVADEVDEAVYHFVKSLFQEDKFRILKLTPYTSRQEYLLEVEYM